MSCYFPWKNDKCIFSTSFHLVNSQASHYAGIFSKRLVYLYILSVNDSCVGSVTDDDFHKTLIVEQPWSLLNLAYEKGFF